DVRQNDWYRVAEGKGVWVLHELRRLLGEKKFPEVMDSFGRDHAGKEVTSAEFQAHVERAAGHRLHGFFDFWLREPGLPPALRLGRAACSPVKNEGPKAQWQVDGEFFRDGPGPRTVVDVTVETEKGEVTKRFDVEGPQTAFSVHTSDRPVRVVVDKYGSTA